MTTPGDLIQLYVLLSYEKLQRSTISQRQRPIEASLRNRLLVWRFLKKIENEPLTVLAYQNELFLHNQNSSNTSLDTSNPWIIDFNTNCDDDNGVDMDIESDIVNVLGSNNDINTDSACETMNLDQSSDVTLLLKRAIGAERRQKASTDSFHFTENNTTNLHQLSENDTFQETEQFFHDLCTELTNTTAAIVSSSTTALNFSSTPEQTLIH